MGNKVSIAAFIILAFVCAMLVFNRGDSKKGIEPTASGNAEKTPSIHVSVSEEKNFVANEYRLVFNVELYGKNKEKLFKDMDVRRSQIFEYAKSMGISEENVEQNSLQVEKPWNYLKTQKFVARQNFKISVSSKEAADSLSELLSVIPDVEILQTNALLKDEDSLQAAIVKKACEKALLQADRYAEGVGEKTEKVLFVRGDVKSSKFNMADSVSLGVDMDLSMSIANSDDGDAKSFLAVEATVERRYPADEFLGSFSLECVEKDKQALYRKMDEKSQSVIAQIKTLGIPESNISVQRMSLKKKWEYEDGGRRFMGYEAIQEIHVKTDSKELATALIDLLAPNADLQCNGTFPLLKKRQLLEAQVILKSGEKALAKAKLFADGLDMKLGKTQQVSDGSSMYEGITVLGDARAKSYDTMLLGRGSSRNVIADSVEVKASTNLVVELN